MQTRFRKHKRRTACRSQTRQTLIPILSLHRSTRDHKTLGRNAIILPVKTSSKRIQLRKLECAYFKVDLETQRHNVQELKSF